MTLSPDGIKIDLPERTTVDQVLLVKARLNPTLNEPYFEVIERYMAIGGKRCTHENVGVKLDKIDRRVYCRGCGIQIDPFSALLNFAKSESRLVSTLASIKEATESEAKRKEREKERRPFVRGVKSRVAVKDMSLKAEPITGYKNTLECGHVVETSGDRRWRTRTCNECQTAARKK